MTIFRSSNNLLRSRLKRGQAQRQFQVSKPEPGTVKEALNSILDWAGNYWDEQGARDKQIRSEVR